MVTLAERLWGYDPEPTGEWVPGLFDEVSSIAKEWIEEDFDYSFANPCLSRRTKAALLSSIATAVVVDSIQPADPKVFQDRLINLAAQALMWVAAERELEE